MTSHLVDRLQLTHPWISRTAQVFEVVYHDTSGKCCLAMAVLIAVVGLLIRYVDTSTIVCGCWEWNSDDDVLAFGMVDVMEWWGYCYDTVN